MSPELLSIVQDVVNNAQSYVIMRDQTAVHYYKNFTKMHTSRELCEELDKLWEETPPSGGFNDSFERRLGSGAFIRTRYDIITGTQDWRVDYKPI